MHAHMLHNGEIRLVSDPVLSAGQVGLLTGWGVFSTIRVYDGVMFHFERHFSRMQHDAKLLRVPFPTDRELLERQLYQLIAANQAKRATLRVSVVRNKGGMFEGPGEKADFEVIGFTREVADWPGEVRLGVVPNARHAASEFSGAKCLSWAQNLVHYERAREKGLDEVLLLNERGEIAECTSANVFLVSGNEVWTPPLNSGCLPGVTRAVLLEEIEIEGLTVIERPLFPEHLEAADEVCITSTTRELLPANFIEGHEIQGGRAVCDRIVLALQDHIRAHITSKKVPVQI